MSKKHLCRWAVVAVCSCGALGATVGTGTAAASCDSWGYSVGPGGNSKNVQKAADTCKDFNQYGSDKASSFEGWYSPTQSNWTPGAAGCVPVAKSSGPVALVTGVGTDIWLHSEECGGPSSITTNIEY